MAYMTDNGFQNLMEEAVKKLQSLIENKNPKI